MLVDEGNSHGDADCVVAGSGGCLQTKFKILFCDMDGTHSSLSLSLSLSLSPQENVVFLTQKAAAHDTCVR
jgi:hypothetical protein